MQTLKQLSHIPYAPKIPNSWSTRAQKCAIHQASSMTTTIAIQTDLTITIPNTFGYLTIEPIQFRILTNAKSHPGLFQVW
jgi:hypothetical protein